MQVFCPNCGHANEAREAGGRVMCTACTTVFEAPTANRPPPPPPPGAAHPTPRDTPEARPFAPPPPPPPPGQWSSGTTPLSTTGSAPYNTLAIASLVCGVLCCLPIAPVVGLALGIKALSDLSTTAQGQKGRELAIVGIVLSALGLASQCLSLIGAIVGEQ